MKAKIFVLLSIFIAAPIIVSSCSSPKVEKRLRLATTTSTENSGLLDVIIPDFEKKTGIKVDVIAVGTGKALKLGENGDVDILMVHAPDAEKKFVADGFGSERTEIMYNDFIIVGPESDSAGIKGLKTATEAFAAIAEKKQVFISRGDDSGTNKKEIFLWKEAGVDPDYSWYMEVGRGMGSTLITASEKEAYTLTDRGTFLSMTDKLTVIPLVEGDPVLYNVYSVIPINSEVHPHVKSGLAREFVKWITSDDAKKLIGEFRINGKELFHPL